MKRIKTDAEYVEKFKARCIVTASGCWEWQGHRSPSRAAKDPTIGYAVGYYRGKNRALHRVMVSIFQRALLPGEIAMHICDNPPCINPDHLRIGTPRENQHDMIAKRRNVSQNKTHCPRGHPFEDGNVYRRNTTNRAPPRDCKACQRGRQRVLAGWPEHLAYSLPPTPKGKRPFGKSWAAARVGKYAMSPAIQEPGA